MVFSLCIFCGDAQRLLITSFAGMSNYQGDLQAKRFTLGQAHFAVGFGLAYSLSDRLYITGNFKTGKISADDKKSSNNTLRNLSFASPVNEVSLGLEYDLYNLNEQFITPYFFAGLAVFHFNPSTIDKSGKKVFLQPLGTEGQGFFDGRKKYSLTQLSIPFGGGVKIAVNEQVRIGVEIRLSKTFTDYLDDVSTRYVDKTLLLTNNGQQAVDLAFRGYEVNPNYNYPPAGAIRGNPGSKDWYYFTGVTLSFRLNAGEGSPMKGGKSRTDCPKNVY